MTLRKCVGVHVFLAVLYAGTALGQVGQSADAAVDADPNLDPAATEAPPAQIPLLDGETVTYRGVLVHVDRWIPLPEQWDLTRPALLEIHFSHSPVLIERLSSMTVSINDNAVDSAFLSVENARNGVVRWEVPSEYLKLGEMNKINITAKMRSDLELCDDVHSPALWLTLEDESKLIVRYREKPVTLDVSRFPTSYLRPDIFYSESKGQSRHAMIVIPANPSAEVLNAVAVVSARFGASTRFPKGALAVRQVASLDEVIGAELAKDNLIIIGHTEFLNKFTAIGLALGEVDASAGFGHLIEARNPWNIGRRALILTGSNDEALAKAVTAVSLPHLSETWAPRDPDDTPARAVTFKTTPAIPEAAQASAPKTATISLADLGSTDLTQRGKFHHYVRVAFPNPYVGRIRQEPTGAFIRLYLSHSELLVPQTSSLLIRINGEPVRSIRLTPRTARRLEADVLIPEKFLSARSLVADLEFFLDIGDPDCHYNFPEMAWVTVFDSSFIAYPLVEGTTTSLRSYPWVAGKEPNLNGLVFVVGTEATDAELTVVSNTAAFLGKSLPRRLKRGARAGSRWVHPTIKTVGTLTETDQQKDVVFVGDTTTLDAEKTIRGAVPEQMFADASADDMRTYVGVDYRARSGWIHLAKSPWNPSRNVLVVSGPEGSDAVAEAGRYLWVTKKVDKLAGASVLVGPNGSMQVLTRAPGEEVDNAPQDPTPKVDAVSDGSSDALSDTEAADKADGTANSPSAADSGVAGSNADTVEPRSQVAYLVFVILLILLAVLVVVRVRDSFRSEK
jgi:hypothetical protein